MNNKYLEISKECLSCGTRFPVNVITVSLCCETPKIRAIGKVINGNLGSEDIHKNIFIGLKTVRFTI